MNRMLRNAILILLALALLAGAALNYVASQIYLGASLLAAAMSGNSTELLILTTGLAEWVANKPISVTACPNPDAIPSSAVGTALDNLSLNDAILFDTSGNSQLALAMLEGAYIVSSGTPSLVQSGAYGPNQLTDPGSGSNVAISIADALNPAKATNYMLPHMAAALNNVDPSKWSTDPAKAAEETAYNASRSIAAFPDTPSRTQVDAAYAKAVAVMKNAGVSIDFAPLSAQSPAAQLAQHLIVGIPDTATGLAILKSQPNVAGFFRQSSGSPGRVSSDLQKGTPQLQVAAETPLIIADDQEFTDSVNADGLASGHKASDLASMSADMARQYGVQIGSSLHGLGVNMDFGAVVDEQVPSNPVIGQFNRGISTDTSVIAAQTAAIAGGMYSQHVVDVLKHFPGHGNTLTDSHTSLATTPPLAQLAAPGGDMQPYKDLAAQPWAVVMVGHLNVPGLTGGLPASESPAAIDYLRKTVGFHGLTITDELGGMVGAGGGTPGQRIAAALNAKVDLALINVSSVDEFNTDFAQAQALVTSVDDSHVLAEKKRLGIISAHAPVPTAAGTSTASNTAQVPGGLNPRNVPEPMRSQIIAAAKAANVPPAAVAALYLPEQNGFSLEYKYYDSGHSMTAFTDLTPTSPEWHLDIYGSNGVWPTTGAKFRGPFQFGPVWESTYYSNVDNAPPDQAVYHFADAVIGAAKYLADLGATNNAGIESIRQAARSYNGQISWDGIRNPDPNTPSHVSQFPDVKDLYADQVVKIVQSIGTGGTGPAPDPVCYSTNNGGGNYSVLGNLFAGASIEATPIIAAARSQVTKGTDYSWGGGGVNGPSTGICGPNGAQNDCNIVGFDCSGLTRWVYAKIGLYVGQVANDQWVNMAGFRVLDEAQAKPGFLVYFTGADGGPDHPGHVGIYLGNDLMVSAPQSGEKVKISRVSTWGGLIGFTDPFAWKASGAGKLMPGQN